jgi:hypothetical protein
MSHVVRPWSSVTYARSAAKGRSSRITRAPWLQLRCLPVTYSSAASAARPCQASIPPGEETEPAIVVEQCICPANCSVPPHVTCAVWLCCQRVIRLCDLCGVVACSLRSPALPRSPEGMVGKPVNLREVRLCRDLWALRWVARQLGLRTTKEPRAWTLPSRVPATQAEQPLRRLGSVSSTTSGAPAPT